MVLTGVSSYYPQSHGPAAQLWNPRRTPISYDSATRTQTGSGRYYSRRPIALTADAAASLVPTLWGGGFADAVLSARMADLIELPCLLPIDK
jgi:hypothetical protein